MEIAIYGASGHGKVVAELAESCGFEVVWIWDDSPEGKGFFGIEADYPKKAGQCAVALGIGSNSARERIHFALSGRSLTLVHPTAHLSLRASVAAGTVILPRVVVHPEARIGVGVILNTACVIEHECSIGDFCHISPGALLAGGVKVGARTHIGLGACVIQGVSIGSDCMIGAGAVVIGDLPDGCTAVGNPARILPSTRRNSP